MDKLEKKKAVIKKPAAATTNKVSRPWQGTILAVLQIIGLVIIAMFMPFVLLIVLGGSMLGFVKDAGPGLAMLFGGGGLVLFLFLLFFFILGIFIVRGLFKGQKWVIIISLLFSALNMAQLIFNFNIFSALMLALFLYLEITCLLHPFYNRKK